jgi:hypothetical protein
MSSNIVVIHERRPVVMNVHEILQHLTRQLVHLLRARAGAGSQEAAQRPAALEEPGPDFRRDTASTSASSSAPANESVRKAVLDGINEFRNLLRRDVTEDDIEMLLDVRIKRISLFDINQHKKEMDDLLSRSWPRSKRTWAELVPYAIKYLKALHKTYAPLFPRRTKIGRFEEVEVRALTATELTMKHDQAGFYFGSEVDGEDAVPVLLAGPGDPGVERRALPDDAPARDNSVRGQEPALRRAVRPREGDDHRVPQPRHRLPQALRLRRRHHAQGLPVRAARLEGAAVQRPGSGAHPRGL